MAMAKGIDAGFESTDAKYAGLDGSYHSIPIGTEHDCPPTYTADVPLASATPTPQPIREVTHIDFSSYHLQDGLLSDDKTTSTTTLPELSDNATALFKFIQAQAMLPPKPVVRITGTHIDQVYSWGSTRIDFDLTLDIMPLLVQAGPNHSGYLKVQPISDEIDPEASVRAWVQQFCDDPNDCKSFTLVRQVVNWDTAFLEHEIRGMISTTSYKGKVDITFPTTYSKVVVRKETPLSSKNTQKKSSNGTKSSGPDFSRPSSSTYEPIRVIWPYSQSPGAPAAVQSEQDWWLVWKRPIRNGILNRKQGWVSVADWKEVAMGVTDPEPKKSWGDRDDWNTL